MGREICNALETASRLSWRTIGPPVSCTRQLYNRVVAQLLEIVPQPVYQRSDSIAGFDHGLLTPGVEELNRECRCSLGTVVAHP